MPVTWPAVVRGRRALENDRRIEELEALAADPLAQRTRWGDISHARDPSDSQADVHARTRAKGDEAEGESVGQKTAQFRTNGEDVMVRERNGGERETRDGGDDDERRDDDRDEL